MTIHIRIEKLAEKITEQLREIDRKSIDHFVDALTNISPPP
jgi:hypothetical protein